MSVTAIPASQPQVRSGLPADFRKEGLVYAIAFDMDIEALRNNYGDPYNNTFLEIRRAGQN
jgi:hypothetical protein